MTRTPTRSVLSALLFASLAAACGSPTAPTPVLETETFTGTVPVNGVDVKTFVVTYSYVPTDASVTLTSLVTSAAGAPAGTTIGLGFGSVSSTGVCNRSERYTATAAPLNQELVASGFFAAGTYCILAFDAGTLTEPLTYTVVVRHY